MTRAYVSRRLRSRRSHIHIEKDDGNKKLRLDNRPRRAPAEPPAESGLRSAEDRSVVSQTLAERSGKQNSGA